MAWARDLGPWTRTPSGRRIAADGDGNLFVSRYETLAGEGTDYGAGALPREDLRQATFLSYDAEGRLRWRRGFGPVVRGGANRPDLNGTIQGVSDDCVVAAIHLRRGTVDFGLGAQTHVGPWRDNFILCLDPRTGDTRWQWRIETDGRVTPWMSSVDRTTGRVMVAGRMRFNPAQTEAHLRVGPDTHIMGDEEDYWAFAFELDREGAPQWSWVRPGIIAVPVPGTRMLSMQVLHPGADIGAGPMMQSRDDGISSVLSELDLEGVASWQTPHARQYPMGDVMQGPGVWSTVSSQEHSHLITDFGVRHGGVRVGDGSLSGSVRAIYQWTLDLRDGRIVELRDLAPYVVNHYGSASLARSGSSIYIGGPFADDMQVGDCHLEATPRLEVGAGSGEYLAHDAFLAEVSDEGRCEWIIHFDTYGVVEGRHYGDDFVNHLIVDESDHSLVWLGAYNTEIDLDGIRLEAPGRHVYLAKMPLGPRDP